VRKRHDVRGARRSLKNDAALAPPHARGRIA
jgi:hypothetical protein